MTKARKLRTVPHLVRKELIAFLMGSAILALFSSALDAPMGPAADPGGVPTENVKAPWIFLGIQEMLKILSPELAGLIIPFLTILILAVLPFLKLRRSMALTFFGTILGAFSALTLWGYLS